MTRRQHRALARGLAFRQADRSNSVEAFLDEISGPLGARGRSARQAILSTAVTAIVVAGVAGGAWWMTRSDPDAQLARQLTDSAQAQVEEARARGKVVEPDLELRNVLLEQGQDYLTLAETTSVRRCCRRGLERLRCLQQCPRGRPDERAGRARYRRDRAAL